MDGARSSHALKSHKAEAQPSKASLLFLLSSKYLELCDGVALAQFIQQHAQRRVKLCVSRATCSSRSHITQAAAGASKSGEGLKAKATILLHELGRARRAGALQERERERERARTKGRNTRGGEKMERQC